MVENLIDKCKRIPIPINDKKFNLYFSPNDLCSQYADEYLEQLYDKYEETQNRDFIIHFYMYKVVGIIFGENLAYGLKKGRRFKTESCDKLFFNTYKSNLPHCLPHIKFESSNFDIPLEKKSSNQLEETFKGVIKNELKDSGLYFDSDSYIDFKCNFLNGLINLTWDNKKITTEKVKQWAERELKTTGSDYKTLLRFDCEGYYLNINGLVHQKVYKAIRQYLSREEKRLFILTWFTYYKALGIKSPYLPFGFRMPSFYRIFLDFYLGMPNPVREDLLNWILFKKSSKVKLNELWDKYLKIYPVWLLISRDEDRINKEIERRPLNSLQEVIARDEDGSELRLEDIIGKKDYALLQRFQEIDILDNQNLTTKEKEVIKLLLKGHSISEIAKEKKVTQPAISKMLKNIREKLRK